MKGVGVSDPVWRRRSGDVMEIPARLLAKGPLWRSIHILCSLYFKSVFIYFYLSAGSLQTFVVEYRALHVKLKTTCVESLDKKTLYNITISYFHKSHIMHKNVKWNNGWCGEKNDKTEAARLWMLVRSPLTPSGIHLRITRFSLEMLGNSFSSK